MKKKPSKTAYWPESVDDHIVAYNEATNDIDRNNIYLTYLHAPIQKLAECAVNIYKVNQHTLYSYEDVMSDVVSLIVSKLPLYKKECGKSFSYFNMTARNYLFCYNQQTERRGNRMESLDNMVDLYETPLSPELSTQEPEHSSITDDDYMRKLWEYWRDHFHRHFQKGCLGTGIARIAVQALFENHDEDNDFREYVRRKVRESGMTGRGLTKDRINVTIARIRRINESLWGLHLSDKPFTNTNVVENPPPVRKYNRKDGKVYTLPCSVCGGLRKFATRYGLAAAIKKNITKCKSCTSPANARLKITDDKKTLLCPQCGKERTFKNRQSYVAARRRIHSVCISCREKRRQQAYESLSVSPDFTKNIILAN